MVLAQPFLDDVLETGRGPVVVDVNDFPNYTGVEEAAAAIGSLLLAGSPPPRRRRPEVSALVTTEG